MSTYRVFLGAPSLAEIRTDPTSYSWRTTSSAVANSSKDRSSSASRKSTSADLLSSQPYANTVAGSSQLDPTNPGSSSVIFPFDRATLEAASQKISLLYKDVHFPKEDIDEAIASETTYEDNIGIVTGDQSRSPKVYAADLTEDSSTSKQDEKEVEISVFRGAEQTTLYTWAPTQEQSSSIDDSKSTQSFVAPSFLLPSREPPSSSFVVAQSPLQTPMETQTQPESQSFGVDSFTSSIGRLPDFHFNPHILTSLTSIVGQAKSTNVKVSRKINALVAVLELEGPDSITLKKGTDAGTEVSIFKMILGDEAGEVCKLTAWKEVADEWGGNGNMIAPKRGDIVLIENAMAACEPKATITFSASAYLKSTLTICYRTMPYAHEDGRLRPDLRLGTTEPCVRKVADLVRWFEDMAGLK